MLFDSGGKDFWLTAMLLVSELEVRMCRNAIQDVPHTPLPAPQPQLSAVGTKMVAGGIEMLAHKSWNQFTCFSGARDHIKEKRLNHCGKWERRQHYIAWRQGLPSQVFGTFSDIKMSLAGFLWKTEKKFTTQICKKIFKIMNNIWLGMSTLCMKL